MCSLLQDTSFTVKSGYLNIVASDFDARPMSYLNTAGDRLGYEPALARIVCERLGLKPVWHNLPMADFYTVLAPDLDPEKRQYDVIWFNQAITHQRQRAVTFTSPYGFFDEAVLVKKESAITRVEDLAGKRVGGLADSTNIALVDSFTGATAVPYPGSDQVLPEMLAALRTGQIDALIDDELVLLVAAAEDPKLALAFSLPTQVPFGIGVAKDNLALLEKLQQTIAALIADGTMEQLWAQWIPWKPFPFS